MRVLSLVVLFGAPTAGIFVLAPFPGASSDLFSLRLFLRQIVYVENMIKIIREHIFITSFYAPLKYWLGR